MAVTHATAIRNGIADYVVDQIDVGGTGTLEFHTSGDVEVATVTFSATAFGAAAAGVATANAITKDSSATGGTIAKFVVKSGTPADVFYGSVTATGGGGDIELSSLVVTATDEVSLTSLTYTAPL